MDTIPNAVTPQGVSSSLELLNLLPHGLVLQDSAGRITQSNATAQRILGLTVDQLQGVTSTDPRWQAVTADGSPLDGTGHPAMIALQTGKPVLGVVIGITNPSNEETVWLEVGSVPFTDPSSGIVQGVYSIFQEITNRKVAEQKLLEQNEELTRAKLLAEQASLAKSQFLSVMSHDLRTPLNAVLGFAQLLETADPPLPAQQHLSVAHILQAGWHLLSMVDQLLDLSLIESGGIHVSKEVVSIADILQDCHSMTAALARQNGIHMDFPRMVEPVFVNADPTRLKQSIVNLLTNAIKYNRAGGSVDVSCKASETGRIRIHVRDTGAGLSSEQIANLFQTFNRLGQENRGIDGSGIGLAVSKQLVELMGGKVGVHSNLGIGSDFWFEFEAV